MGWIVRTIKSSPIGLLEYARTNPVHDFHTLRDGGLSYIHEDGSALNVSDRIAYLEVQGLAYDALHAGARLIEAERADEAESWKGLARELKQSFLKYFWMEDQKNFAIALDRDPVSLKVRQVKLLSSVQPELLGSTIFDKLPEEERTYYVESVARALFTDEFLTDIGIRSMALRHNKLFNGCYTYQGPCTVWPIMTHLAARGLRYQGLHALARDLSVRMLNGIHAEGECREFLHVAPDGSVIYDPKEGDLAGAIFTTDIGELDQAWTIAAALEANRVILPIEIRATDFERRLLPAGEPTRLLTLNQVRNAFFLRRQVKLNLEKGKCIERELSIKLGYGPPHHPEDKVLGPP